MVNCGKILVAAWFVSLGCLLASLVVSIFTFSDLPVVTVVVLGGATGVLLVVSLAYLCLVSLEGAPTTLVSLNDSEDGSGELYGADEVPDAEEYGANEDDDSLWYDNNDREGYERV